MSVSSSIRTRFLACATVAASLMACAPHSGQTKADATGATPAAAGATATASNERAAVAARLDGETITMGDVDDSTHGALIRAQNECSEKTYEVRSDALDALIDDRLMAKKAKAEGLDVPALIARDITAKITPPGADELKALYDQAVAAGRDLPPFDQIKDEIAKFIQDKKAEEGLKDYHEKLRATAKLERVMPPLLLPKVEVAAVGPTLGEAAAPVTIIEFSDYQCPYCGKAEPTVRDVLAAYKGKVRLVYREFPLDIHDHAEKAAEAALCALDQNKYWEMHDKLFQNQRALEIPQLKGYAKDLQLDQAKFDACLDGNSKADAVAASSKAGQEAGVNGTPAFFINGRPISGAQPFERFKEIIDSELATATR